MHSGAEDPQQQRLVGALRDPGRGQRDAEILALDTPDLAPDCFGL
jgi:hypothetical protein